MNLTLHLKKVFLVEVEVKDGVDFNPKVWEASLNIAYETSGKFKVSAQHSVQRIGGTPCPECGKLGNSHANDKELFLRCVKNVT